jgi:hypothetical protein
MLGDYNATGGTIAEGRSQRRQRQTQSSCSVTTPGGGGWQGQTGCPPSIPNFLDEASGSIERPRRAVAEFANSKKQEHAPLALLASVSRPLSHSKLAFRD